MFCARGYADATIFCLLLDRSLTYSFMSLWVLLARCSISTRPSVCSFVVWFISPRACLSAYSRLPQEFLERLGKIQPPGRYYFYAFGWGESGKISVSM